MSENQGTPQADVLAQIFENERARLLAAARGFIGQASAGFDEQDVVQEAWLRIHSVRATLAGEDRRYAYGVILGTLRRVVIDLLRAQRAQKRGGSQSSQRAFDEVAAVGGDEVEARDIRETLLAQLTHRQRETFELLFLRGLTGSQAAKALRVSDRTLDFEREAIRDALKALLRER